jgi:hypothetical protein
MDGCHECYVLSGRDLGDELITRPEESYRLWCVVLCDLETSFNEEALAHWGGGGCRTKTTKTPKQQQQQQLHCQSVFD